jgi:hypothetical protein
MQGLGIKLLWDILNNDTICALLVWVKQNEVHLVPKIQSLIDDEDVWLSILRADRHRCNSGNGNILYGFILTTVRMNSNLMTFVRDAECYSLQHMYRVRVEFSSYAHTSLESSCKYQQGNWSPSWSL